MKWKWKITPDAPKNESGLVQMIGTWKCIRHKWVNQFNVYACYIFSAFVDKNFALLSDLTHNRMYQIDLATGAVHAVATRLTERATTLMYNNNTQKIIWNSHTRKEVIDVNLDGTGEKVLGKIGRLCSSR